MFKHKFYQFMNRDKREWFTVFFVIQVTMLIMILVYWSTLKWGTVDINSNFLPSENILLFIVFLSGVLGLIGMVLMQEFLKLIEKEKELELQKLRLEQMKEANLLLHAQRHDFLNNIQVITGMLYLGQVEKAQSYLKNLMDGFKIEKKEIEKLGEKEYPYLYTLFLNKMYKCKELDIDIVYKIEDIRHLQYFEPIDVVRILGNLLDNAIYEVKTLDKPLKNIIVILSEDQGTSVFEVYNPAPVIPKDIQKKVFDRGFTTKKNEGTGMGLYNVRNIVEKYGGSLELISEENYGTKFIIKLPFDRKYQKKSYQGVNGEMKRKLVTRFQ